MFYCFGVSIMVSHNTCSTNSVVVLRHALLHNYYWKAKATTERCFLITVPNFQKFKIDNFKFEQLFSGTFFKGCSWKMKKAKKYKLFFLSSFFPSVSQWFEHLYSNIFGSKSILKIYIKHMQRFLIDDAFFSVLRLKKW